MRYRSTKHTEQDRTGDVAKDVEQREIEDTARGVAEPIDMENAEHFTGIAAPAERKASETEDASVFAVNMPGNELNNDWIVQMYVKNSPLKMEIDTGASCNVLSLGTLNSLGVRYNLQQNNVFIKGVHGQSVKSVGRVSLPWWCRSICIEGSNINRAKICTN